MEPIGKYSNLEDLDPESPGRCYRGEDSETGESVVLRVMDELSLDQGRELVSKLGGIDSPFVACWTDVVERNGIAVLVRKYVPGRNIERLVSEHLPLHKDTFRVVRDVARGLKALYDTGLSHSRIRGCNVIVDDNYRAVLVDVGWAQPTVPQDSGGEQAEKAPSEKAIAADFRGVGVVLYQLCTGQSSASIESSGELSMAGLSGISQLMIERLVGSDPDERFESVDSLLASFDAAVSEGAGEEIAPHLRPRWTARQYISMAILMLLIIIFWIVVSELHL